jgi:hypothetical protein
MGSCIEATGQGLYELRHGFGEYEFSATHDLNFGTLTVSGYGGGSSGSFAGTRLWFKDCTGIRVQDANTSGATTKDGVLHFGGSESRFRNFTLFGSFNTGATPGVEQEYHGIHARTTFHAENVYILRFAGDGYEISGDNAGPPGGNANQWTIKGGRSWGNRRGLAVGGTVGAYEDTNGGHCFGGFRADLNRWCGLWEGSYLGNKYDGASFSTNGWGGDGVAIPATIVSHGGKAYNVRVGQEVWAQTNPPSGTNAHNQGWLYFNDSPPGPGCPAWFNGILLRAGGCVIETLPNSLNVYSGCYVEEDQGKAQILPGSLVEGGFLAGWRHQVGDTAIIRSGESAVWIEPALRVQSGAVRAQLGAPGNWTTGDLYAQYLAYFDEPTYLANGLSMRLDGVGCVAWKMEGGSDPTLKMLGPGYTGFFGRPSTPATTGLYVNNFYLGPDTNTGRKITFGSAAPSSGEQAQGNIEFNNAPVASGAGSNAGWHATSDGLTGGSWKQFGGTAAAQADLAGGATLADTITAHNTLLAKLRDAGLLAV